MIIFTFVIWSSFEEQKNFLKIFKFFYTIVGLFCVSQIIILGRFSQTLVNNRIRIYTYEFQYKNVTLGFITNFTADSWLLPVESIFEKEHSASEPLVEKNNKSKL